MALISLGIPSLSTKLALSGTNGVVLIQAQGLGMPPVQNQVTDYAVLDGGSYQKSRTQTRTIMLQLAAMGTSWSGTGGIHAIRKALVNAVNPHRATGLPIKLYYEGNSPGRHIDTYYDAGLEMGEMRGFSEVMTIRLLAPDPYFYANTQATAVADELTQIAFTARIVTETKGVWATMANGCPGSVYAIEPKAGGGAYVGGAFRTAGATTVQHIGLWTGTKWNTLGGGIAGTKTGSYITAICEAPNGDVYVGGLFNTAGSTAAKNVAMWDVSARTWCKLSTGVVGVVRAMDINRSGNLVVAGSFNTAGGVTMRRIALWNGAKWTTLGAGLSAPAWAIGITPIGQVVVGGTFHTAGAVESRHIGYWTGPNAFPVNTWRVPGTYPAGSAAQWGMSDNVYAIAMTNDRVYAGGAFHTAGVVAASHVAIWNMNNWNALGSGVTDICWALKVMADGSVAAGGSFNTAGGHRTGGIGIWNGYDWVNAGAAFTNVQAIQEDSQGRRYYGGTFTAVAPISARSTITNNGTAKAWPVITIAFNEGDAGGGATAHVLYLKNETNGKTLYFDYEMVPAETLTIDCRPGHKSVTSSFFGTEIKNAPLPGSDLATFCLEPGANVISAMVDDITLAGGATITFAWNAAYWGGD